MGTITAVYDNDEPELSPLDDAQWELNRKLKSAGKYNILFCITVEGTYIVFEYRGKRVAMDADVWLDVDFFIEIAERLYEHSKPKARQNKRGTNKLPF